MQIRNLMTTDPICCTPGTPVHDVAQLMAENDCGAVPVIEDTGQQRIIGVVTDRDIAVRAVATRRPINHTSARDVMTETPVIVVASGDVEDVRQAMGERQLRRVLVAGEDGACAGIIAQADLARALTAEQAGQTLQLVSAPAAAQQTDSQEEVADVPMPPSSEQSLQ